MVQLIKYSIIRKIKNFNIIFWPCIFPLIMGTLFYFGFGNMSESDFETVQAGYVEEGAGNPVFSQYLEEIEKGGILIHVETMTETEAKKQLKERQLDGIFFRSRHTLSAGCKKRNGAKCDAESSGKLPER